MFYITFNNYKKNNFTLNEWYNLPFEKIKNINFNDENLTELPNLDKLVNLIYLNCGYNQLTSLPNLDKLVNLEELYVSYNQLIKLPNLDKLINLKWLHCNNNKLTSLPNLNKLVNLKLLECNNNQLTSLPNLNKLINLKYLGCYDNKLISLPINIKHCKKLKYYKKKYDITYYLYLDNHSYIINKLIEKYYDKPILDYYNSKYFIL